MKILLVEDHPDLASIAAFAIEAHEAGAAIRQAASLAEAARLLASEPRFDAVVSELSLPDGRATSLLAAASGSPVILLGNGGQAAYPDVPWAQVAAFVEKSELVRELPKALARLRKKPAVEAPGSGPRYCRISLASLARAGTPGCDLFLKLGDDKYLKVANRGDAFSAEDAERFTAKKTTALYVLHADSGALLDRLSQSLASQPAPAGPCEALPVERETLDAIHRVASELGFTPEAARLTKEAVDFAVRAILKSPRLEACWSKLGAPAEQGYIVNHSTLLAHVCCTFADAMGWRSELTFRKLALAAFAHDLLLRDDRVARIRTTIELSQASAAGTIDYQQSSDFLNHPLRTAEAIREIPDFPPEADLIVRQHHEWPDGSGFPARLNWEQIAPLSAVFIVAHDLVNQLLRGPGEWTIVSYLNSVPRAFESGTFKKLLSALRTAVVVSQS